MNSTEDSRLFRRFKRQYQLVKKNYLSTPPTTGVELKYRADAGGTAQFTMSDESASAKFWNLMRPFLNEGSTLYFRSVWNRIKSDYADRVDQNLSSKIEAAISAIDAGLPHLQNESGKYFLPEKIYELISASGYFYLNEEKKAVFERLTNTPLLKQLLWFEFDNYHHTTFNLISLILEVVRAIDDQPEEYANGPCIYCLRTDVSFSTEEHIYPESLGNDEAVLPKGTVCDECNNRFSELDKYLIDFLPISYLRTINLPFTKKGKFPRAEFQDVTINKIHPTVIQITNTSTEPFIKEIEKQEDGTIKFRTNVTSKERLDGRKLGRALFKIGLGMLALDNMELARSPRYQTARDYILRNKQFKNVLLILRNGKPNKLFRTNIIPMAEQGTIASIDIWGVGFVFNLEEMPRASLPEPLNDAVIEISLWE